MSDEPEKQEDAQDVSRVWRQVFNESVVEEVKGENHVLDGTVLIIVIFGVNAVTYSPPSFKEAGRRGGTAGVPGSIFSSAANTALDLGNRAPGEGPASERTSVALGSPTESQAAEDAQEGM